MFICPLQFGGHNTTDAWSSGATIGGFGGDHSASATGADDDEDWA